MKEYKDIKRTAEAALTDLCRIIRDNLSEEETQRLYIELSMSLFTASLDFSLPIDKFAAALANKQASYTMQIAETVIRYKHSLDAGEGDDYDFEEI